MTHTYDCLNELNRFTFSMDKQNPAEVEDFTYGARMTSGETKDGAIKTQGNKNLELKHGRDDSPLFATAVNSRRLL